MAIQETRSKTRKKKEDEKMLPERMLTDKKVRGGDASRQHRNVALPETQKSMAEKRRRKIVIVDKQKRVGELSKLCSELKKGNVDVKREKKKMKSKKKKKKQIDDNDDLALQKRNDDYIKSLASRKSHVASWTLNGSSSEQLQMREKEKKDLPLKDVNQNEDIASMTMKTQKDKTNRKKPSKIQNIGGKSKQKTTENSSASDRIGAFDMGDLERSVFSIGRASPIPLDKQRRKKKIQKENEKV